MRTRLVILLATICGLLVSASTSVSTRPPPAQTSAQERAASLRLQLADLQARQVELQTRLRQLEEDLKPENIENSLAGVGSTHPEDLRAQRRRELEMERTTLRTQLDLLAASRTRLETGIAQADADAYRQSAGTNAGRTRPRTGEQQRIDNSATVRLRTNSPTVRRRARRVYRTRQRPRHIRRPV